MSLPPLTPIFLPLFPEETEDKVLADMLGFANEGVADTEEEWVDVREGSLVYVAIKPGARKIAQLYDLAGSEVPASAHPLWAWGNYLDDLAAVPGLVRHDPTLADGVVTFTGTPGTVINAGVRVGVEPATPDADAAEYDVVVGGTIPGSGILDRTVVATTAGTIGNAPAHSVTSVLTPGLQVSVDNVAPMVGGAPVEDDEALRARFLARYGESQGGSNVTDLTNWALEVDGVGFASVIPLYAGPGTSLVVPMTVARQPVSSAVVLATQDHLDPPAFRTTLTAGITLPVATIPVVSTVGSQPATNGFIRLGDQVVQYTAKTGTSFTGCTGGTGSFLLGAEVVQGGRGHGRAAVGQHVTVRTAGTLAVTVAAIVELDAEFSLDGAGGTVALRDDITASLQDYFATLGVGDEVVQSQVGAAITNIRGVHDVGGPTGQQLPTLNGVDANLAPTTNPPQLPALTVVTLTEGSV